MIEVSERRINGMTERKRPMENQKTVTAPIRKDWSNKKRGREWMIRFAATTYARSLCIAEDECVRRDPF